MDGLGPKVSEGDQVLDAVLSAGVDVVHPAKTFGIVVGLEQRPERVTHLVAYSCDMQKDSIMD